MWANKCEDTASQELATILSFVIHFQHSFWEEEKFDEDIQFKTEYSKISISLLIIQLWVSE